jgi:hypothetical protein
MTPHVRSVRAKSDKIELYIAALLYLDPLKESVSTESRAINEVVLDATFSEGRRFLGALEHIHSPRIGVWCLHCVASGRRVKAQDRYLPTFQMRASYPTDSLPLGRSASPQLLRWC